MRYVFGLAALLSLAAMATATQSQAIQPMGQLHAGRLAQTVTFDNGEPDYVWVYGKRRHRSRYIMSRICGFGHEWHPFPTQQAGGFFDSPGPCRYRHRRHR